MFQFALAQYAWQLQMCQTALAQIDDADLARQPVADGNHPAWILGHLAVTSESLLKLMGQIVATTAEDQAKFARGSKPVAERAAYPSKEELLARLTAAHAAVAATLSEAAAEVFSRPNPLPIPQLKSLPTVGNLCMHVLTTHEAFHLGQLSAWRRAMGFAPMF
jgi:uncharacterized damage-inducible protein DinB